MMRPATPMGWRHRHGIFIGNLKLVVVLTRKGPLSFNWRKTTRAQSLLQPPPWHPSVICQSRLTRCERSHPWRVVILRTILMKSFPSPSRRLRPQGVLRPGRLSNQSGINLPAFTSRLSRIRVTWHKESPHRSGQRLSEILFLKLSHFYFVLGHPAGENFIPR